MKFSCDTCGQRYSSADEPEAGHSYRILCLVCGGMVRLKGGAFPALPTFAADPAAANGPASPEAGAEEPVLLALAPMAQREPPAAPPQRVPRMGAPRREPWARRWTRFAAAGGVAIATLGAGALLVTGGPRPEPRGEGRVPRGTTETAALPAGTTPVPVSAFAANDPAGASTASPPQERQGAPAVAAPVAPVAEEPGPGREASPLPSMTRTAPPPPAKPALVSSAKPAPSPASKVPAATRPAAVPQEPPAAAPTAPAVSPGNARHPTPEDVAAAVSARRPAFEACLQEALRNEPGLLEGGLRVDVVVTVNPIGIVTSPQVDEPLIQDTALGECLRNVVRKLLFPAFEGEPFQARIPLVLGK